MNEEEKIEDNKIEEPITKEENVNKEGPIVKEEIKENVPNNKNDKKGLGIVIAIVGLIVALVCGIFIGKIVFGDKKDDKKSSNNNTENTEKTTENTEKTTENTEKATENTEKTTENTEKTENTEIVDEVKTEELTQEEINTIMEKFNGLFIRGSRLYEKDKFEVSELNNEELFVAVLDNFGDIYNICSQSGRKNLSLSEFNNELNKYVNKSLTIDDLKNIGEVEKNNTKYREVDISIDKLKNDYYLSVIDDENIEVFNRSCGSLFAGEDFEYNHIIKGEKTGDIVYIYEKVAFGKYTSNVTVNYYKDYNKAGDIIEEGLNPNRNEENSTPNWDLYDTYKYTFKLIDGNYYFQSYELVK